LLTRAAELVITRQSGSATAIQKELRVGYIHATGLLDHLEDRDGLGGVDRDVLGIAALAAAKPGDARALGGVGDALPYGDYFAGALDAGDERRRQRRRASPLVDVHVVDACRAHTDQDLSGPGGRPLAVGRLEDSGVPGPGHCYCAHRPFPIWLSRLSRGAGGLSAWSG